MSRPEGPPALPEGKVRSVEVDGDGNVVIVIEGDAHENAPDEVTSYTYNLQGRMDSATVDSDADGYVDRREEYEYDDSGIRVAKTEKVDSDDDGNFDTTTRTDYHIDHHNHTGYAQVLEEMARPHHLLPLLY